MNGYYRCGLRWWIVVCHYMYWYLVTQWSQIIHLCCVACQKLYTSTGCTKTIDLEIAKELAYVEQFQEFWNYDTVYDIILIQELIWVWCLTICESENTQSFWVPNLGFYSHYFLFQYHQNLIFISIMYRYRLNFD